jgi:uncharacterized protein
MRLLTILVLLLLLSADVWAQRGPGDGRGPGFRGGQGRGFGMQARRAGAGGQDDRHDEDRDVFHFLLSNHQQIQRTVKELPDGVETLTESRSPEVAAKIKEHVHWMAHRIEQNHPIRMRDPLFAEIFKHTDKIQMKHEETENGVRVVETSEDPYVAQLIQAHAKVVSAFVERGHIEARKNHPVPEQKREGSGSMKTTFPAIEGYGAVVRLPQAVHQPRDGTKILIDVTQSGKPDQVNAAIAKVAKYLNIYAGGGESPAKGQFAVVFHGGATLTVLNDDAYAEKFGTEGNPNLDLLHQLHEQGVELTVCGQALIGEQVGPEDVAVFVDTAVSAMTAVVNLQTDGYSHLQLGN